MNSDRSVKLPIANKASAKLSTRRRAVKAEAFCKNCVIGELERELERLMDLDLGMSKNHLKIKGQHMQICGAQRICAQFSEYKSLDIKTSFCVPFIILRIIFTIFRFY